MKKVLICNESECGIAIHEEATLDNNNTVCENCGVGIMELAMVVTYNEVRKSQMPSFTIYESTFDAD